MAENNRNWRDESQYDQNMNENTSRYNQRSDYGSQDYEQDNYDNMQRTRRVSWQGGPDMESYGSGYEYGHSSMRNNMGNTNQGSYGQSYGQGQNYQGYGEFSGNNPVSYGGRAGTRNWENEGNFDRQQRERGMNRLEDQSFGNYGDRQGSPAYTHRTGGIFGSAEIYSPMRDTQSEMYARMGAHTQGSMYGIQDMGTPTQRQGLHRGKGPKGYRRSDERIREDVCDRLCDDHHIDASDMEITVKDCEVVLSGTVDSREAKRRAEDIAESISGVSNVENRLRVRQENNMDDMMRNRMDNSRRSANMSSGTGTPSASSDGIGTERKNKTS